jgi:glutaredoxin 2
MNRASSRWLKKNKPKIKSKMKVEKVSVKFMSKDANFEKEIANTNEKIERFRQDCLAKIDKLFSKEPHVLRIKIIES